MLCCCWCFCTSDAFHSKIRNDSSDQVCAPAYLCIYIERERDVLAYIYIYLSPFIHLFIYVFMYLFYFLFYVSICINPQLAHCL